jgi:hypothetical protein
VHSGSNTARYTDPDTGEAYTIEHRGADNFRAVLSWVKQSLAEPARILVAGSSAGAYGAATHYARIRDNYPDARVAMIGDAGQGVMTESFLEQRTRRWRAVLPMTLFARDAALTPETDLVARLAQRYPRDSFAQYTTAQDLNQSSFYALMGAENACANWTERMLTALERRQAAPNFRSYLAAGDAHSILRTARFYTEQSGGTPFAEWLEAMLAGGPAWQNRACQQCETRRTRCPF